MSAYDQFTKANQSLPYFVDNSEPMLALESMIDAVGLRNVLREFNTANFQVVLSWEWEDYPDVSWDDTGEVREKLESGEWGNFCFGVHVYLNGSEVAADYLGNSIYADPMEFAREHIGLAAKHRADGCNYGCYFPDMLRTALNEARSTVAKLQSVKLRAA